MFEDNTTGIDLIDGPCLLKLLMDRVDPNIVIGTKVWQHSCHIILRPTKIQDFMKGSANRCEGYCNSDLFCLLRKSQAIQYCNQSVLLIVPDQNIFLFGIMIVDLISSSSLVRLWVYYVQAICIKWRV